MRFGPLDATATAPRKITRRLLVYFNFNPMRTQFPDCGMFAAFLLSPIFSHLRMDVSRTFLALPPRRFVFCQPIRWWRNFSAVFRVHRHNAPEQNRSRREKKKADFEFVFGEEAFDDWWVWVSYLMGSSGWWSDGIGLAVTNTSAWVHLDEVIRASLSLASSHAVKATWHETSSELPH